MPRASSSSVGLPEDHAVGDHERIGGEHDLVRTQLGDDAARFGNGDVDRAGERLVEQELGLDGPLVGDADVELEQRAPARAGAARPTRARSLISNP